MLWVFQQNLFKVEKNMGIPAVFDLEQIPRFECVGTLEKRNYFTASDSKLA